MIEITGALTAARTLAEMAKTAIEARDDAKAKAAVAELQGKLFDATSAALAANSEIASLQSTLREVEQAKRDLEAQIRDQEAYSLVEIRPGAYAYTRATVTPDRPNGSAPYYCQACYGTGLKSVLQYQAPRTGFNASWACAHDQHHVITVHGTALRYSG